MAVDVTIKTPECAQAHHRTVLSITGMTCGACAAKIENKLNKLPEVTASVNYATGHAIIDAPPHMSVAELISVVTDAGFAATPHSDTDDNNQDRDRKALSLLGKRLLCALIALFPLADLSFLFASIPSSRCTGWQWILVGLATPVAFWCAYPFHKAALNNLRHRTTTMDTLISLGVLISYFWSVYTIFFTTLPQQKMSISAVIFHNNGVYFEVCAGVTAFVLAGKYWEYKARLKSLSVVQDLEKLYNKQVAVLVNDNDILLLPREELKVGQKFIVGAGTRIGADGVVDSGSAAIDSSAMTGELKPYNVQAGNKVFAGTMVIDGPIIVTATQVGKNTQLAAMINLVHQAQLAKSGIHKLVDTISRYFVPTVIVLSLLSFILWHNIFHASTTTACSIALSVLVIACPCALGLATPLALLVASSTGTKLGIYIRSQQALETIRQTSVVVFDKTGTLTTGELAVSRIVSLTTSEEEILALTAALEDTIDHPVSTAICTEFHKRNLAKLSADQVRVTPGLGIQGQIANREITAGTAAFFADKPYKIPTGLPDETQRNLSSSYAQMCSAVHNAQLQGNTIVWIGDNDQLLGMIILSDQIRNDAAQTISTLHQHKIATMVLSGDSAYAVKHVADTLNIHSYQGNLLPADKARILTELKDQQPEGHAVVMVGDGINDAPALATANLGIAIGRANDIACAAADIMIVSNTLATVITAMKLAQSTVRTIHTNLFWALSYNIIALPIAMCGGLSPIIASAAMAFSSFFVVTNSLRLEKFSTHIQHHVPGTLSVTTDAHDH